MKLMGKYFHPDADYFRKVLNAPPPATASHATEEEISEKLKPVEMTNWRLEGNKLIAQTELGEVVNFIDPSYICEGTDNRGFPILKKIA